MKTTITRVLFVVAALLLLSWTNPGSGQTLTWDSDTTQTGAQDGPGIWDTLNTNWWTGTANTTWNSSIPNAATFGAGTGQAGTVTLGENISCANITFNHPAAGNYTIAGGGFTLALTNRSIAANASATISANIVGDTISLVNSAANAPIGTLTLAGNNTFGTRFNLGPNAPNTTASVRAASSSAFGTGTVYFSDQGNATSHRIELVGSVTITNPVTWYGRNNVAPAFVSISGANTWAGPLNFSYGGSQYPIEVHGSSTFTVAGTTTIQTSGSRSLILGGTGTGYYSGNITGGSASGWQNIVNKAGSGTWTLSGSNTFVGTYAVSGGTLILDYSTNAATKLSSACPLVLDGGTLTLNGGTTTEIVSSNILLAGQSRISRAYGNSTLRLNLIRREAGSVVDFATAGIADTDSANTNGILGGYATVAGADWAVNSTGGADGPISAYTGYTDIAARGSVIPNSPNANIRINSPGTAGNITLADTLTTINTLLQNSTTPAAVELTGKTLRLGAAGGVLVPAEKGTLTLGTSPNEGTLTAGGADNTPGEVILINNSANNLVVNATIADNGMGQVHLTKAGAGPVTLAANNTHTGTNYIVGGTLNISSAANLGSGAVVINGGTLSALENIDLYLPVFLGPAIGYGNGTINVAAGKTLNIYGTIADNDWAISGFASAGSLTKTGPGTLVLQAANTYSLGTIINGGTVVVYQDSALGGFRGPTQKTSTFSCYRPNNIILNGGVLQLAGSFTLNANRGIRLGPVGGSGSGTISVDDFQTVTFNGQISDNWGGTGTFVKAGGGTLVLGGAVNDYSGDTIISAGTLQLGHARAIPSGPGKGNLTINSGATLDLNGYAAAINGLSGSGTITDTTGAGTLRVGFNDASSTFSGNIEGFALSINKMGSGTLTLSGTVANGGTIIVSSGTLRLVGTAAPTAATNITVAKGAILDVTSLSGGLALGYNQVLTGLGTVAGNVSDGYSAVIAPGGNGTGGTLSINGNLTLNGNSTLMLDLAADPASTTDDQLNVSGTVTINGPVTLSLNYLDGLPGIGTYTVIKYGSFSGNVANFQPPVGFIVTNNTAAREIQLVVARVPANLTWRGDGMLNVWDMGTTPNWVQGGIPQVFMVGDHALFDDSGSNQPAINIASTVYPGSVTVNASKDYTFTGEAIASGSLTKAGNGTLVIENNNTYPGATVVEGGTLQIGNFGTSGTIGSGPVTNNALIVASRADILSLPNQIWGTGTLKLSAGELILSGSNAFTGPTVVESGILHLRYGAALGATNMGTYVSNGAQLYIDANMNVAAEPLLVAGTGPGSGALRKGGAGTTVFEGPVTLLGDAMFFVDGNATLILTNATGIRGANLNLELAGDNNGQGVIAGPVTLGNGALTKSGASTWTLLSSNSYTGKTIINGGLLRVTDAFGLGHVPASWSPDWVTINGGGLVFIGSDTLADNRRGITFNADAIIGVETNATLVLSNDITGYYALVKAFPGRLVLNRPQGYSLFGPLYLGRGIDGNNNDGIVRITRQGALQNFTEIQLRNTSVSTAGGVTLELDGTIEPIAVQQPITINCRNNFTTPAVYSVAGSNVLLGPISIQVGGNVVMFQTEPGATLRIDGAIQYVGTLTAARNIALRSEGPIIVNGQILESTVAPIHLVKDGSGYAYLMADNTYPGDTLISNGVLMVQGSINSTGIVQVAGGTLGGTGTINANVTVLSAGTLAPGTSIGTLTVYGWLTNYGTIAMEVNKSGTTITSDQITGLYGIVYGGTLQLSLSGTALAAGDSIKLFNAGSYHGAFSQITPDPGPGLAWDTSTLALDGTLRVKAAPLTPPRIASATVLGGTNIVLNVTNGVEGAKCYLLSSTNVTLPLSAWARVQTNVFGPGGTITISNTVSPAEPQKFFSLQVE